MSNETKKFAGLGTLQAFLDGCKTLFANITHKHTISDITDYIVDEALSDSSANPVQNKVINAEFDAIAEGMGALESAIDDKAELTHTHDDRYYTETEIDSKLSTVNTSISNIINGSTTVAKAEEASYASSADTATSATKTTQDADGNIITSTYETKADASAKLEELKQYTDTVAATKADSTHNHDSAYDAKGSADTALESSKKYTDSKVSGLVSTTVVDNKISTHNTSTSAHNDIRDLIDGLTTRLNTLADSDDTTLDQMSEVVAYIKANKDLIDSVTTSKVNVSDIVNNLITNVANKPLSAGQGVYIKSLIDTLQAEVDTKALASDLTSHTSNSTIHITSAERTNWNDANSKKHSHTNKTVLDGITSDNITSWDSAEQNAKDYVDDIAAQKSQVQFIIWEEND